MAFGKGWLFLLLFGTLSATEIRLMPPHHARLSGTNLVVDARTGTTLLDGEILEYLNYGIVITFTYFVELWKVNRLIDDRVASATVSRRVYYDLWSEQYFVESVFPVVHQTVTKRLDSVRGELQEVNTLLLTLEKPLDRDSRYRFRTRVTMKITQLNSLFHVLFNLLSVFKFRTTWLWGPVTQAEAWITP